MTDLGVLGVGRLGAVDASGGLTPAGADWTLRWWIGSEDRWHVPPVEAAVRQTLVGDTPVVETRVRVVSGDIVHHAFAATGPGGAPTLVAEITNETPVPVAIGLVMDGAASVEVDGAMLTVDGLQVRLPRAPSEWVAPVAFVPLTHKATLRVVLAREAPEPADLPDAEQVAAGWRAQGDVGSRWALPEPTITAAADAARGFLLVHDEPDLATTAWLAEARHQLGLRDEQGFRSGLVTGQRLSGRIPDATGSEASTGQALVAFGWAIESDLIGPVAKAAHAIERRRRVRKHRKDPQRAGLLPAGPQPPILGHRAQTYLDDWWCVAGLVRAARLLEAGAQLEASVDAWRFARGLAADIDRSITAVLAAAPPVLAPGARARALLADVGSTGPDDNGVLAPDPVALAAETGASTSDGVVPAGPGRAVDAGIVGILVGTGLGAVDPEAPAAAATLDLIRDELTTATGGVTAGVLSEGWSPWLTALLARTEIGLGDARGLDRLRALATAAAGKGSWPELVGGEPVIAVDPADHHGPATAAFLLAVRSLLVVERGPHLQPPDRLAVLPVLAPEWYGQGIELHDTPTAFGEFGFAVRWHGDRPALLWELEPSPTAPPFRIEAPALDPAWSSTETKGEALLAPWKAPGATDVEVDFS